MKARTVEPEAQQRSTLMRLWSDCNEIRVETAEAEKAATNAPERPRRTVAVLDTELQGVTDLDVLRATRRMAVPWAVTLAGHFGHVPGAGAARIIDDTRKLVARRSLEESLRRDLEQHRTGAMRLSASGGAYQQGPDCLRCADDLLIGERNHRLYPLQAEQVDYIHSDANYVTFHLGAEEYVSRDSLKRLADRLARRGFVRIGRSLLVNIRSIHYAQRTGRGSYEFTLTSGRILTSGPSYREEILRMLPLEQTAAFS